MNHPRFRLLTALCILGLAACAIDEDDSIDDDGFRIINGDPASWNVPKYAATIALHQRFGDSVSVSPFCSGTLIHDDVVLTAAHCCDEAGQFAANYNPMEPDEIAIYFGSGPAYDGVDWTPGSYFHLVSEVLVHPSYNRQALDNDICLLRLSTPNTEVTPIPRLPAAQGLTAADVGTNLDHVGFGFADLAMTDYGEKLQAVLPLASMGCQIPGCFAGASQTTQFSYVQSGAGLGPCNGDSGGPQFIQRGNQTFVAGITSYGDAACHQYGVSTNVSAFQTFIDDFVGEVPVEAACGDAVCDVGESCDGRGGTTSCKSDCPGKTKGKPSSLFCWVDGACEGPGC